MCNKDIREYAKKNNIRLWKIAQALNINDGNFSRRLRNELPVEEKTKIFSIIDKLNNESKI